MRHTQDIRPTRAGLFTLRHRLRLARKAHRILGMKRDGLMLEIIRLAEEVRAGHDLLMSRYARTRNVIAAAYMIEGTAGMTVAAYSVEVRPGIETSSRRILGVTVPEITGRDVRADLTGRGYGLLGTTLVIDDLADAYGELLEVIIRYAGNVACLTTLLAEMERVSRRVKALEFQVIPDLEEIEGRISRIRDENEREESNRLFLVKRKKERSEDAEERDRRIRPGDPDASPPVPEEQRG